MPLFYNKSNKTLKLIQTDQFYINSLQLFLRNTIISLMLNQSDQTNHKLLNKFQDIKQDVVFKTQAAQGLLDKDNYNRETFEIDGSNLKKSQKSQQTQSIGIQSDLKRTQQFCYPKCLSCLGSCLSPFLITCPCIRCNSCCQMSPLFRQPTVNFGVLQRWGSFKQLLPPGLHIINPISQKIIEINRQTKSLQFSQIVFTKDNVQFKIDSVVFYRVVDPLYLAYKLGIQQSQTRQCVCEIAQACLRNLIGIHTLQNVIEKRQIIANNLTDDLNSNLKMWGIHIEICALKEIILSKDIKQYLQSTARAKRMMQAQIINYQAQVQIGKLIKEMSQILSTKAAFQIRYLDTIGQIIQNNNNTVIMIKTQLQDSNQTKK